jgi:hypothetical protein
MAASDGLMRATSVSAPYRQVFRRSLTLDVLGPEFSDQARLAEAAAAAGAAVERNYEAEIEHHFSDAVSARGRDRWGWVGAALVSAGGALAYLLG